jgi:hypothetical protein
VGEVDFRRTLTELGEQKLQMLIASDVTRSWVIYLTEDLKTILAFHGRLKPGSHFRKEDASTTSVTARWSGTCYLASLRGSISSISRTCVRRDSR